MSDTVFYFSSGYPCRCCGSVSFDKDPDPGSDKFRYGSGSRPSFDTDSDPGKNDTDPDPDKNDTDPDPD